MKKILLGILTLALVGCRANETSLSLDLTLNTTDPVRVAELIPASQDIVKRMTFAIEQEEPVVAITNEDNKPHMDVVFSKKETKEILLAQLQRPFSLRMMRLAKEGETPDFSSDRWGDFIQTDIDQRLVDWVVAAPGTDAEGNASAVVNILLTEGGKPILQSFFEENVGERIGLFVHDGLVSTYTVQESGLSDSIVISGIPSLELAEIFADDVNVGLHVTFTSDSE